MPEERFTEREMRILFFAPCAVMMTVAYANGKPTAREVAEFKRMLGLFRSSTGQDVQLIRNVLLAVDDHTAEVMQMLDDACGQGFTFGDIFWHTCDILGNKATTAESYEFRAMMVVLAKAIAEASRPLLGPKISPEERAAVEDVSRSFGF